MLTLDIITARRWSCCFYDNQLRSELVVCHIHSRLASLLLLVMGESPIFPPSSSVWRTSRMSHIYTICENAEGFMPMPRWCLFCRALTAWQPLLFQVWCPCQQEKWCTVADRYHLMVRSYTSVQLAVMYLLPALIPTRVRWTLHVQARHNV